MMNFSVRTPTHRQPLLRGTAPRLPRRECGTGPAGSAGRPALIRELCRIMSWTRNKQGDWIIAQNDFNGLSISIKAAERNRRRPRQDLTAVERADPSTRRRTSTPRVWAAAGRKCKSSSRHRQSRAEERGLSSISHQFVSARIFSTRPLRLLRGVLVVVVVVPSPRSTPGSLFFLGQGSLSRKLNDVASTR